MNRTLSIFALLALLFSTACSSTSIVHLINGEEVVMDISRSDGETLYGVDENRTRNIQIRQRDVAEIEFPGSTEILVGAIATGVGGAATVWSGISLVMDDDFELTALTGAALLATGIPILVWGIRTQNDAIRRSGTDESFLRVDAAPMVLHDGERPHYGVGISGLF